MPDKFPANGPMKIWQNQPTESFKMSAEQLRRKVQERYSKSRLDRMLASCGFRPEAVRTFSGPFGNPIWGQGSLIMALAQKV